MIKKVIFLISILIVVGIFLKSCIRVDVPEEIIESEKIATQHQEFNYNFLSPKTVYINGVEYLQTQVPVGKYGGKLISSTIGEGPKTFNPWNSKDATSSSMADLMFDSLVTTNAYTGEVEPKLAKSFSISNDGKEYIFKIRKGVQWSDGKQLSAKDVFFTYDTIIARGFGNTSTRDSLLIENQFPKVELIDEYTVKFTTKKPFAPFLRLLSVPIAPKHILEPVCAKGHAYFESFWSSNAKPSEFVTSGAFKLSEYVPAQRVIFKKNPNYYVVNTNNEKLPYLDEYVVLIVGDLNNELLKFKAGEIDILSLRGSSVPSFKKQEEK